MTRNICATLVCFLLLSIAPVEAQVLSVLHKFRRLRRMLESSL